MNQHEAKFLLRAFRPDGQDARDPVFAEALAAAENDPRLKAWLEREELFDQAMRGKLREVQPPPGLREAILAGSRVSRRRPTWWKNPAWLALAAAIAITLTVTLRFRSVTPSAREFTEFALQDLATTEGQHRGRTPDVAQLQTRLASSSRPLPGQTQLSADELRRMGCRAVTFAGHEVFEFCFQRNGTTYHLYAMRTDELSEATLNAKAFLTSQGILNAATWKEAGLAIALVTDEGMPALQRVI